MTKRIEDASWLCGQIRALAKEAQDNVSEDAAEAELCVDPERIATLHARVDTAKHYHQQLLRILSGQTWSEALTKKLKGAR